MTDTPRKTLTLKRKPASEAIADTHPPQQALAPSTSEPIARETRLLGKRIIRRDEPISSKPSFNKPKPHAAKNKKSHPKTEKSNKPQQSTEPSPSEIQAKAMDRFLAERFEVWQSYKPLALGVEADLYQLMDQNQPPASKRVIQRLLRMHCNHGKYLQAVIDNAQRYNLAGEALGEISLAEREHAQRTLQEHEQKRLDHLK